MGYKIDIDYQIMSSLYWLNVYDLSSWGNIDQLPSIIEITLPGEVEPITNYFQKGKVNAFNSNTLLINCDGNCDPTDKTPLLDGLYHFKVIGSPDSYFKESYFLKDDQFQNDLDKVYVEACANMDTETINSLTLIEFLRNSAHSAVRLGLNAKAMSQFSQAQKQLEKFKTCHSCV